MGGRTASWESDFYFRRMAIIGSKPTHVRFRGEADMSQEARLPGSVANDPKRSLKPSHSPTTEVLASASHKLGR
jgi:hypothetical protein